ncbi:MAG: hypothetical protein GX678_06745 [Actinomycetales bacterium]|nr:hypothetical protein [Actinomycetales bacterium]
MNTESTGSQSVIGASDVSDWLVIDQEHLSEFGHSTYLDAQYVDLTISKNNALGPTLVDGFMLLSLLVYFDFAKPMLQTEGGYGFNYGFNRVRFTEPVFVNEAVRVRRTVIDVQQKTPTRQLVTYDVVLEVQRDEPVTAMVAHWIVMAIDGAAELAAESANPA